MRSSEKIYNVMIIYNVVLAAVTSIRIAIPSFYFMSENLCKIESLISMGKVCKI